MVAGACRAGTESEMAFCGQDHSAHLPKTVERKAESGSADWPLRSLVGNLKSFILVFCFFIPPLIVDPDVARFRQSKALGILSGRFVAYISTDVASECAVQSGILHAG